MTAYGKPLGATQQLRVREHPVLTRRALLGAIAATLAAACTPSAGRAPTPAAGAQPAGGEATRSTGPGQAPAAPQATAPAAAPAPAATGGQASAGSARSTVVFGSFSDARSLNPLLANEGGSQSVWENIYEPLVGPDPQTGVPRPVLAERWEVSPDGRVYTFSIRDGVRWSDGQPLTAADARLTFDLARDPRTRSVAASRLEGIQAVDTPDARTLRVTLKEPSCPFLLSAMQTPILPAHRLQGVTDLSKDPLGSTAPLGTGPYTFVEWQKDNALTLAANPSYWRGKPKIDRWIRKVVKDANVLAAQLKTAEVDYASIEPGQIAELEGQAHLRITPYLSRIISFIAWNGARPQFQDKRVRQALTHALDREQLLRVLTNGQAQVLDSPIVASSWAYDPNVPRFPYDLKRAQQLLAEAGWTKGADGLLRDAQGRPFTFTLITNTGNKVREGIATVAQDQYRQLGIQMDVKLLEFNAFTERTKQSHDFDAAVTGTTLDIDPDVGPLWASTAYPNGDNIVGYANPDVDRLLAQARSVPGCTEDARRPLYAALQRQIAEDQPVTFIYQWRSVLAANARLQNLAPSPWIGTSPGVQWNIHAWGLAS